MASQPPAPRQDDAPTKDCRERWSHSVNHALHSVFEKVSEVVIEHPIRTIAVTLVVALVFTSGITLQETETNPDQLFTPTSSKSVDDQDWVESVFGEFNEQWNVYFRPASGQPANLSDPSVLKSSILEVIDVRSRVLALESPCESGLSCDVNPVPFSTVCVNATVLATGQQSCLVQSVGDYFNNDPTVVSALSDDEIRTRMANTTARDGFGRLLELSSVAGGTELSGDGSYVLTIGAYRMTGFFEVDREPVDGAPDTDPETFSVGVNTYNTVFGWDSEYPILQLLPLTQGGQQDTNRSAISEDFNLFVYGYILLLMYTVWVLGNRSWVKSRSGLAFAVVVSVMMAVGSCFGLVGAMGVKFNNVVTSLLVILLGLGVDDAFVIVDNYAHLGAMPDIKRRMRSALGRAGSSILATSMTDMAAFASGTQTILPAIRAFCIYSTFGILFDFAFQITFFVACMHLDNKRQAANKPDGLCCCSKTVKEDTPCCGCAPMNIVCRTGAPLPGGGTDPGLVQSFMENTLPKLTLSKPGKVVVLLMTAGLLTAGAVGLSKLETQFNLDWFSPANDKIHDVYDVRSRFFTRSIPVTMYTGDVDYFALQTEMEGATAAFEACGGYAESNSVFSWFRLYNQSRAASPATDANDFYTGLDTFVNGAGKTFASNLVWNDPSDPTQGLKGTSTQALVTLPEDSLEQVDMMKGFRDCVEPYSELEPRAWTFFFVFLEGIAVIEVETLRNVGVAALAVLIVSLILLADLWAAVLVFLLIIVIDIDLLGFLYWCGLEYNSVTTVNIVLSIGLSVDYSMHIAHSFLTCQGTKDERAAGALAHLGKSVLNGGVTTFLAIVVLAASQSYIFSVFMTCFALTIGLGLFHGLIFLPVLLSLVGPKAYAIRGDGNSTPKKVDVEAAPRPGEPEFSPVNGGEAGAGQPKEIEMSSAL